jgi:hypothetical protein
MEEFGSSEAGKKGGKARAARLTPEERKRIAKNAAIARWDDDVPLAVCGAPDRPLKIGDREIQAYVLEDGTRVLTQGDFLEALGKHRKANVKDVKGMDDEERTPEIIKARALKPYISQELIEKSRPIRFRTPQGIKASGYRAEILPQVCEAFLKARDANALQKQQEHIAAHAEILIRGLAHVGIIALVDEATGYQEMRTKDALARILEAFIDKELRGWIETFPADFYKELFRLRGLHFPTDSVKRPQYFGILTNDIVYRRLTPGVLGELRRITPKDESGRRKHKYFQRLTSNIGYPKLKEHLGGVVAVMKLSSDWADFMDKLERLYPVPGETMRLPFPDLEEDDGKGL